MGPKTRRSLKAVAEKKEEQQPQASPKRGSQEQTLSVVTTRSGRAVKTPLKIADMTPSRKAPQKIVGHEASRKTPPRKASPRRTPQSPRRTPQKKEDQSSKVKSREKHHVDKSTDNQRPQVDMSTEDQRQKVDKSKEVQQPQVEEASQDQQSPIVESQADQQPQVKESQDQQLQIEEFQESQQLQIEQHPNVEEFKDQKPQGKECEDQQPKVTESQNQQRQIEESQEHQELQIEESQEHQPNAKQSPHQQFPDEEPEDQQPKVTELQNQQPQVEKSQNQQAQTEELPEELTDESQKLSQLEMEVCQAEEASQPQAAPAEVVLSEQVQAAMTEEVLSEQAQVQAATAEVVLSEQVREQAATAEVVLSEQVQAATAQEVLSEQAQVQIAAPEVVLSEQAKAQLQEYHPPPSVEQNLAEEAMEEQDAEIIVVSMEVDEEGNHQVVTTTSSDNQHPNVSTMQQLITTVAAEVNASSQHQDMELEPGELRPLSITESPIPVTTQSHTPHRGPSHSPSGTMGTPTGVSPETPSTSNIVTIFDHQSSSVSLLSALSQPGMQYVVPFDQQSLMSSTIGSPGVRKCGICGKVYRNRNGLYKHRLAKHPHLVNANKPIHCQQAGCTFDCHRLENLRDHITEAHKVPLTIEKGNFASMAEFIQWKERLEKENCANFVKTRGASGNTQGILTKHRYYCSRSGFHNSKSTGKRRKVTTKMGAYCTAGINVLEHRSTGAIQAEACITHHGHPIQLEYLKIPPKDKREIATQIVKGKKWDNILSEYHESGLKQGTRSSILCKKDLMNIQRIVNKHLPGSEQGDYVDVDHQVEIDGSDFIPPPSATESETEIAIESLQRLGEVVTTNMATLRDGLLSDLDQVAQKVKDCVERESLLTAGNHVKAALDAFKVSPHVTVVVNGDGSSRTRLVREPQVMIKEGTAAGGDAGMSLVPGGDQTLQVEVADSAMNLLESMEKDTNSDVRVPTGESQEGEDDMPVITYRLVPAAAENATCPLDSLATTSQYRTLGIRLTKEMLYTLSLICEKHQMDRLLSGGNLINREEVEIICSKLPDEVIDADMTSIRVLLERDAWYLLESAVELKRSDWKCGLCDKVTGKLHMIRCCSCNNWFHWVCVEIEEQPTEEWFCPGCILRKRMQAIQTKKSSRALAAAEEAAQ